MHLGPFENNSNARIYMITTFSPEMETSMHQRHYITDFRFAWLKQVDTFQDSENIDFICELDLQWSILISHFRTLM